MSSPNRFPGWWSKRECFLGARHTRKHVSKLPILILILVDNVFCSINFQSLRMVPYVLAPAAEDMIGHGTSGPAVTSCATKDVRVTLDALELVVGGKICISVHLLNYFGTFHEKCIGRGLPPLPLQGVICSESKSTASFPSVIHAPSFFSAPSIAFCSLSSSSEISIGSFSTNEDLSSEVGLISGPASWPRWE